MEKCFAESGSKESFAASSFFRLATAYSAQLVKLFFVHTCLYRFLNFACFSTVCWRQEFGDKINLFSFLQICGALEILCFVVVACALQ